MPGELRQNALTGRWIAVAPRRARRPADVPEPPGSDSAGDCPFCPGNEDELPGIITEVPSENGTPWSLRVVPNRYPAFSEADAAGGDPRERSDGLGLGKTLALGSDIPLVLAEPLPAAGHQEVIIETPRHDADWADLSDDALTRVVDAYHSRYVAVSDGGEAGRVFIFRNRGRDAGNTLSHPHTQLVATTTIPPEVRVREIRMMGYHGDHGRCLLCSLDEVERQWEERQVSDNEHFRALVPWAAESPYEVWVIPKRHQAELGEATDEERAALASILGDVARRYRQRAGDPDYNLMVHSAARTRAGSRALHWFVQLRPRVSRLAGFEMSTGIHINTSLPERDAAVLRGDEEPETPAAG